MFGVLQHAGERKREMGKAEPDLCGEQVGQ